MDIEIPGYQLLRTIGKGGMATVFLAQQSVLERKVALKIMSKALAEEKAFGERFMREARIVSQLVHPNIVTVHEVGQHDGRYFLSMEYIDGHDLRTVGKKLDVIAKIRVIEDIARALHYAGEKGYVHRDIKPENIMFRSADGSAVLTDFGIAKAVKTDLSMTQTGTAIGTPHYMSPEQAKGKRVDHRSDLYSLGIVFYQLLTGKVPFDAETAVAIGIKHITEPVPALPPEFQVLQPIFDGLLAKRVENRYQSGLSLLNDLRTIDFDALREAVSVNGELEGDADALTVLSNLGIEDEDTSNDTDRFTIEFETLSRVDQQPVSVWPMAIAAMFVVSVIAFIVYLARPAALEPWIVKIESSLGESYQDAAEYAKQGKNYVEEKASPYLSQKDESLQPEIKSLQLETKSLQLETKSPQPEVNNLQQEKSSVAETSLSEEPANSPDSEIAKENGVVSEIQNDIETAQNVSEANTVASEDLEAEIAPPAIASVDEIQKELDVIQRQFAVDSAYLSILVSKLYEGLAAYPNEQAWQALLEQLAQTEQHAIFSAAEKGNEALAKSLMQQYNDIFSRESASVRKARSADVDVTLRRVALMQVAKQQLADQQVSVPEGNNAVATLKSVLSIDPEYAEAKALLQDAANAYVLEAKNAYENNELSKAKVAIERGLNAVADHSEARQLSVLIREAIAKQDRMQRHLAQAKQYSEHGYLYTPDGANAYDEYQAAKKLDANSQEASQGELALMDQLSVLVWKLVGESRFNEARELLQRPIQLMPNNERILSMQAAINEVSSENRLSEANTN